MKDVTESWRAWRTPCCVKVLTVAAGGDAGHEGGTLRGSEGNGHRAQDPSPCGFKLLSPQSTWLLHTAIHPLWPWGLTSCILLLEKTEGIHGQLASETALCPIA